MRISRHESRSGRRKLMWRKWALRFALLGASLVLVLAGCAALAVAYYGRDLPPVESLREYHDPEVTRVVDRNGAVLGEIFEERRTVVSLERIPRHLVLSILAAEDADFYRHRGLDYLGLLRAVVMGVLSGGHFRGTSTITQQVARNLLLTRERTAARKIREFVLTRRIEAEFSKDEILGLYLNHINFGHGRYGVQEASRFYFGKDVSELTLAESSLIAGIPQRPASLSPRTHPENARRRQRYVLAQLAEKRAEYWPDLSEQAISEAANANVSLAPAPEADAAATEVVEIARRELFEMVGAERARTGGFTVETGVDAQMQGMLRAAIREGLESIDVRQHLRAPLRRPGQRHLLPGTREFRVGAHYDAIVMGSRDALGVLLLDMEGQAAYARTDDLRRFNPDGLPASRVAEVGARVRVQLNAMPQVPPSTSDALDQEDLPRTRAAVHIIQGPEAAAVLIDLDTRNVLAMVGGYSQAEGFNRATSALRQPGSAFKPIVYAAAIRTRRYTPATLVLDAPGVYDNWQPQNFETWTHQGPIRLREALAQSVNQVAVRLLDEAGNADAIAPRDAVALARRLGITSDLEESLGLALGASVVRPIELVNAYASLGNGGRYAPYCVVSRILDREGMPLRRAAVAEPVQALGADEAFVILSMLSSVVDHGTASAARALRIAAAGKTGTTNNAQDAWFVGVTTRYALGVWVGYDDNRTLGRRESGARTALPIWISAMRSIYQARHPEDLGHATTFAEPSGLRHARIDPVSGLLAREGMSDALDEVFLDGTVPTEFARERGSIDATSFVIEELGGTGAPQ